MTNGTPGRPCTVAIASGKGGVGKTWCGITLAHALALRGARVLLVDGDLGLANADIQLGLSPTRDMTRVLAGEGIAAGLTRVASCGFDMLAGRSGSGALASLETARLDVLLRALGSAEAYDVVLVDVGAGLEAPARRLAAWARIVLLVVIDEPTSLTDAYAVLKLLIADRQEAGASGPTDCRILVNLASGPSQGQRTFATIAKAAGTFLGVTPELAGIVRRDEKVRDAIRHQTPLLVRHPGSPAATDVGLVADEMLERIVRQNEGRPKG